MTNTSRSRLEGRWQAARDRVQNTWADLSDNDWEEARGKWDSLVERIRQRSGQSIRAIEQRLGTIADRLDDDRKES